MISAILLAAGQSQRMKGQNKLLKHYKGKYLINHILNTLVKSRVNNIFLVLGFQNLKVRKIIIKSKKILPNASVNLSILQKSQLVNKKYSKLKLLGSGDIKEKFDVETNFISKSAKEKIEKLGGKVTLIK